MAAGDVRSILRAKYHDWCSARVADRFVTLTPEQIYAIAHGSTGGGGGLAGEPAGEAGENASATGAVAGASSLEDLTYAELVQRVTEVLSRELGLPDFETWSDAYRRNPAAYDAEMLGLWEVAEDA